MPLTKTNAVIQMHNRNKMIAALIGGESAMRAAGQTYLPQNARESDGDYKRRLQTSVLFPALSETLSQMVGRVFFKPIQTEQVASSLQPLLSNVDLQNNNLDIFTINWFYDALAFGASYVLVDFPTTSGTLADNRNTRPYLLHIQNHDVLGFKHYIRNGKPICTQFRYQQKLTVDDGEFGEKQITQITVWDLGRIRRYRYNDSQVLTLHDDFEIRTASGKPLDFVPVVDLVFEPTSFFIGNPPLEKLAFLNVKHWQMQSDYHNIVRFTSIPLLAYSGDERFGEADNAAVAVNNLFDLGKQGSLQYIEHSGAAIGSTVTALEQLKEDMATAGAKLLTRTKLALTDSQARDEQGKEISKLRMFANRTTDAIGRVLDFMAMWLNLPNHDGGVVQISGNIDADFDPSASFADVLKMQAAGIVSNQTVFEEAQARSIVSPQRNWQDEQNRLELQGGLDLDFRQPKNE